MIMYETEAEARAVTSIEGLRLFKVSLNGIVKFVWARQHGNAQVVGAFFRKIGGN